MKQFHPLAHARTERILKPPVAGGVFFIDEIDDLFTEAACQTSLRAMDIEYLYGCSPGKVPHDRP